MLPLMELRWMSAPPEGFSNKGINYPAVTHPQLGLGSIYFSLSLSS